jgi:peptidoglycan/xylan/chitin deacetylase (PgdA/CDA1 family)
VSVGVSSYGSEGNATRRGRIRARPSREDGGALELRFALSDFGSGRFRWAARSGWSGPDCAPQAQRRRSDSHRRSGRTAAEDEDLCLDRVPDSGFARGRFRKLERVGCARASPLVNYAGSRRDKQIALTFDDGPSAYTSRVVSILDRAGAKGTFFLAGSQIPGRAGLIRRSLAHGHELGNHSTRHELFPSYASLAHASALIEATTGFLPCTFRPPYGAYDSGLVGAARSNGMSTVIWDVDTGDWSLPGPGAIYSRAVGGAHPGAIILMHDGGGYRGQTVAALPGIVSALKSRGYDLVTVTEILGERFIWEEAG